MMEKNEQWIHSSAWVNLIGVQLNQRSQTQNRMWGFPGGAVVKNPPANAGDTGLSPGLGRSHMLWSN